MVAVNSIKEGKGIAETATALVEKSGVGRLRDVVISHFGNRAYLIKLHKHLTSLTDSIAFQEERRAVGAAKSAVAQIRGRLSEVRSETPAIQEFEVLQLFYDGKLSLSDDETRWMLEVTGEYGVLAHERLGASDATALQELAAISESRMLHFRRKGACAIDRTTQNTSRVLEDAFGGLLANIEAAAQLLGAEF
jgi:hypothetical protein